MSSRVILPQSGPAPPTSIHAAPDSAPALMASSMSAQQQEANMDFIYHQTIIPTQKITHCVEGTFTVPGATDFAVVRNDTLELWTLHVDRNIAECVHATRLFSRIYQIAAVPTVAAARSVSSGSNGSGSGGRGILDSSGSADSTAAVQRIAVTSETGYLVLLRYDLDHPPAPARLLQDPTASLDNNNDNDNDNDKNDHIHHGLGTHSITSLRGQFVRVSEVSLGRSGARLTAPGARLAVDPLGRAVLVTALMRLKVIVPLRRRDDYKPDASQRRGDGLKDKEDMEDEEDPIAGMSSGIGMGPAKRRLVARDVISFASPVEAHRQTLIFSVCALDGATENATFATLEQEIREVSESQAQQTNVKSGTAFLRHAPGGSGGSGGGGGKQLVVYAFVSGLQQVQRTHLVSVPATAHRIVAVPAAPFGPGGVLLCTDTEIIWYDLLPQLHGRSILGQSYESNTRDTDGAGMGAPLLPGLSALSLYKTAAPFPRRDDFRDQLYDPMIIAHASTCVRNDFFMLLQDDQGDVFRVVLTIQDVQRSYDALRTIQTQSHKQQQAASVSVPSPLTISYFDTIPPTSALVLFRRGFVFAASESAVTHGLYKIVKDGYRSDKEYILSRMRMVERGNTSTRPKSAEVDDAEDAETLGKEKPVSGVMGPPTLRPMRPPAAHSSRVVPLFLPHTKLQHMVLLESYPNTPPVLSFVTHIHGNDKSDQTSSLRDQSQQQQEQQQQQQQVQVDAVVGRGSDSAILHARYGYAARLESTFTLPAVFTFLRPLSSAIAMRQRWFEMQQDATVTSQRFVRPRRRRVAGPLWDDKLLLSTRQGTTILSLTITGQVEPDTLSGFVTSEHTIAAGTLRRGVGYAQVTPSCILILPHTPSADMPSMPIAEGMTWTHPHSKRMLAAAVSSTTIVVSFTQGGGIASFDMGPSGTRLQQLDMVPTFPHVPAISLLYDPDGEDNNVGTMSMMSMSRGAAMAGLAAIATVSHEVFIVNPKKLREPLETIYCLNQDNVQSNNPAGHNNNNHSNNNNNSGGSNASPIASVLLTYLGRTDVARRLFCFIGHTDGTVTRCELDTATCKVMDRAVLTCGVLPCQMIAGDGERVCYILSGDLNWRCDVRDGLAKTVPWRFPSPQAMYAAFRRPPPASKTTGKNTTATASATVAEEMVLGVTGNTLSLFSAKQNGGGGAADAAALEYSFAHTPLSVAGRRVLQHPTRPECVIVIGTEHRGYGVAAIRRAAGAGTSNAAVSGIVSAATDHSRLSETAAAPRRGIPLDKPQRSLNHRNHYASTLQLYNRYTDRLDPPMYFPEGEAVLSATVGSFVKDFGKEPIVVVGCAEQFTHGSGCGTSPSWLQGRLRAYRFAVTPTVPGVPPSMRLEQLHDTLLASEGPDVARDYPSALHICSEVGLLFVGMGKESGLHVYGWGQRRFLRKRRLPNVPGRITSIETVFIAPPGHSSSSSLSLASGMPTGAVSSGSGSGGGSGSSYAGDLFRCLPNSIAREHRLLILCGTLDQSVFLATVQPAGGSAAAMSFLMIIARDAIPRAVTSVACLDARTYAVADRFGTVAFLRLPKTARLGFAEPLQHMTDAEIVEAEAFAKNEQLLDEVAVHNTGQLVTCMRVQEYDPSAGTDPSLAIRILFYATTLGAIGAYTPFVREEDAALAAHLQPLVATHFRCLFYGSRGHLPYTVAGRLTASPAVCPVHRIFEGDLAHLLLKASTAIFSTEAKAHVEAELQRLERTEGAQRKVLGLPHRIWPALSELVAKQRALVTLPP